MDGRRTALAIDDNSGVRALYSAVCRQIGLSMVGVGCLAQAREELRAWAPAVVILDLRLPDGSGLELLADLAAVGSPPVICATAATLGPEQSGIASFAFRILPKPFDITELQSALEAAVAEADRQEHALKS